MKAVNRIAAQGDMIIIRVGAVPANATEEIPREDGLLVLAHSETGHHHAIRAEGAVLVRERGDTLTSYLTTTEPVVIEHHRPWDTHAPLALPAGTWKIRRQREYTPEGWRRVED